MRTSNACNKYTQNLVTNLTYSLVAAGLSFAVLSLSPIAYASEHPHPPGWVENPAAFGTSVMRGPVCRGSFVWQGDADESKPGKIRILSDNAARSDGLLRFSGGVTMIADNITISSDDALYEEELNLVRLSGAVDVSSPQLIATAFDASYQKRAPQVDKRHDQGRNQQSGKKPSNKKPSKKEVGKSNKDSGYVVELTQGVFSQPASNIHGYGSSVIYEDSVVIIKDAKISFCEPSENTWYISGKEVRLNLATMQGRARGAKFHLGETPVMYIEYLPFPLGEQRQTGFLAPNFNYNSRSGFIYTQPVYFNLAPHYDSTLYPQFIENRGFLWEQDFRWLTKAGEGALGLGYIHRDALFGDSRSAQYFKFSSVVNDGWSGEIDWTGINDKSYLRDLPSVISSSGDLALPRFAHVRYADKWVDWVLGVRDYQFIALDDSEFNAPYVNLPYSRLSLYSNSAKRGLYVENILDYSTFRLDDQNNSSSAFAAGEPLTGENERLHNGFTVGWQAPFRWGQIHSRLNWQSLGYRIDEASDNNVLTNDPTEKSEPISRNHYSFDTDISLSFSQQLEKSLCNCYLTFEPRLYGFVSKQDSTAAADDFSSKFDRTSFFDTTPGNINYDYLFTQRRFRGLDRFVTEDRLSLGVQSRLIDLDGKGVYVFRAGTIVSESLRSDADYFANASTPWATDLSFIFNSGGFLRFDTAGADNGLHSYGLTFSYANRKKSGVSVTYRKQEQEFYQDDAHQLANNFAWYVVPRWSLFGGWRYNLDANTIANSVAGFGYENCCFKTVTGFFSKPNGTRQETGAMVQFSFGPLGSLGTSGNTGFATLNSGKIEDIYRQFR